LKSCRVLQDHYDDERDKIVFHNTTPDLQDQDQDCSVQDQDQDRFFLVSDRSCPKTDGLRPHHSQWQAAGSRRVTWCLMNIHTFSIMLFFMNK